MKNSSNMQDMKGMSYKGLYLMLIISFVIMYLVMFLNMDQLGDYFTSTTRMYMTLLMVSPMAIVMVAMMFKMYKNKTRNITIMIVASIIFILSLVGLRQQAFISDIQYMKGMIPHHSSAIMTSLHANIKDAEVRRLADSIIASQRREIEQMKRMIGKLEK